uniref:AlNc14C21G2200 protein n=1 Tax=Albugo laibachii Nc14 TaxID=890382 RepID=F0W5N5_9STRA|nr:AlNc14C21G2200 [Albugo laibachii Nc14]|eukprot:CCA16426.1 AlNc14C21G2200 [Albugo laibachii Nc14]
MLYNVGVAKFLLKHPLCHTICSIYVRRIQLLPDCLFRLVALHCRPYNHLIIHNKNVGKLHSFDMHTLNASLIHQSNLACSHIHANVIFITPEPMKILGFTDSPIIIIFCGFSS